MDPAAVIGPNASGPVPHVDQACAALIPRPPSRGHPDHSGAYFFEDGNLFIQARYMLFKVHRHFFQHYSDLFKKMFSLPPPSGSTVDGLTANQPLYLDVDSSEFEWFLSVFYPTAFTGYDAETIQEWASIFKVAIMFEFDCIRQLAASHLERIASPIDKIIYGRLHPDYDRWRKDGYVHLCRRDQPVTMLEGTRLGLEDVILIGQVRHRASSSSNLAYLEGRIVEAFSLRL